MLFIKGEGKVDILVSPSSNAFVSRVLIVFPNELFLFLVKTLLIIFKKSQLYIFPKLSPRRGNVV